MARQTIDASYIGMGTSKYAGTPDDLSLAELLAAAEVPLVSLPDGTLGFDLQVLSGTCWFDNDGSPAGYGDYELSAGDVIRSRNPRSQLERFRFVASDAIELRIMLWGAP